MEEVRHGQSGVVADGVSENACRQPGHDDPAVADGGGDRSDECGSEDGGRRGDQHGVRVEAEQPSQEIVQQDGRYEDHGHENEYVREGFGQFADVRQCADRYREDQQQVLAGLVGARQCANARDE